MLPPQSEVDALVTLFNSGRFDEVVRLGESLIVRYPQSLSLYMMLGAGNAMLNCHERAAHCFRSALRMEPDYVEAHNNLGLVMDRLGRHNEAIDCYKRALAIRPDYAEAHFNLGNSLTKLDRKEDAVVCYERALQIKANFAEALYNLGNTLKKLERKEEAIAFYERALQIKPDYVNACNNLGNTLKELGRGEQAIECYERALQANPHSAFLHYNFGNMLMELGRHEEAIARYEQALLIDPTFSEALYNLGNTLKILGRRDEAITCYGRALQINPNYADAHNNLGNALSELGRTDDAIACYDHALQIDPGLADAHYNLGNALSERDRNVEAIACYERALQINPGFDCARVKKLYQHARICDWDQLDKESSLIPELGISGDLAEPFRMLSLDDDPGRNKIRSQRFQERQFGPYTSFVFPLPLMKQKLIRIGYFSSDFYNHATMSLVGRLFELHDRTRFTVYAYSYGTEEDDKGRSRLKNSVDVFRDISSISDGEASELARRDELQIAIDLKGYTNDQRLGIFAWGAAPVQISYLGYPGTTGAPFVDYLVADRFVVPANQRDNYTEKIIYLPDSYQVNDSRRAISDRAMTRANMGLPENGFVFCCFNNTYKISPAEFDIWMRLLRQVDNSALWLYRANEWVVANLRKEAKKRGIDADRLIFAEPMAHAEHLARQRLADLFLDTFNYNAHTTASDALWAGLPVLTKAGNGFAARVAGSLLNAVGLSELITTTQEEYERVALELATNTLRLREVRRRLEVNRATAPLFDTELFARHIETAYEQAYNIFFEGREPIDIEVEHRQKYYSRT